MATLKSERAKKALKVVAENEPLTEVEASEKVGGGWRVTMKSLYTHGFVKRNRRGRGGDFILTEQGREAVSAL